MLGAGVAVASTGWFSKIADNCLSRPSLAIAACHLDRLFAGESSPIVKAFRDSWEGGLLLLEVERYQQAWQHRCQIGLSCNFEAGHGKSTVCNQE
jgi:hypothetical protein